MFVKTITLKKGFANYMMIKTYLNERKKICKLLKILLKCLTSVGSNFSMC